MAKLTQEQQEAKIRAELARNRAMMPKSQKMTVEFKGEVFELPLGSRSKRQADGTYEKKEKVVG